MKTTLRRTFDLPGPPESNYGPPFLPGTESFPGTLRENLDEVRRIFEAFRPEGELKIRWLETAGGSRVDFRLKITDDGSEPESTERFAEELRGTGGVRSFERGVVKKEELSVPLLTFTLGDVGAGNHLNWGAWWESADNSACGDLWASVVHENATTFLVSDGVGRGREAREASRLAAEVLRTEGNAPPDRLMEVMHQKLQLTAGAVVFVGRYRPSRTKLEFCTVGNLSVYRVGTNSISRLIALNGMLGYRLPQLQVYEKELPKNSGLVLHTDGLNLGGLEEEDLPFRTPSLNAAGLLERYGSNDDDALAAVLQVT